MPPTVCVLLAVLATLANVQSIPVIEPPNVDAELVLESRTARLELSATEASARFWAKDNRGMVYAKEALQLNMTKIGQIKGDYFEIAAANYWNRSSLAIGQASCHELSQTWILPNNASFRVMWMYCDKDEALTIYADPRYNQPRWRSGDDTFLYIDFDGSQNKSIFANAIKLSWEVVNWPMQGVSLDRIRVDGTLQSDFILGDKTPWEALQIGIGDPVVLKEYSMTLSTQSFSGKLVVPTWGVGDYTTKNQRQFDGDFDFHVDPIKAMQDAIASNEFNPDNRLEVQSLLMPMKFRSGETRSFAYYDPDFIVLFSSMNTPTEGPSGVDSATVGIAAGLTVGSVVLIAAVVAGIWYVRRRNEDDRNETKLSKRLGATQIDEVQASTSRWRASKTKDVELFNSSSSPRLTTD